MEIFIYNSRSEVLAALFGTNGTAYAYDDIGNHSLYPANSLNQYLDSGIEYDSDGDMTRHGDMDFTWDAENRLTVVDNGVTNIVNAYDYKHRRVSKNSTAYLYDGWNLLRKTTGEDVRHYFWGLDLSDSPQGAGGVGGLLAVSQDGSMYYPVCDNNGNITAYLDDFGNTVAAYEYNAFGETLSQSGSKGNDFAFRFSTKYHDNETGLYYYGYRFYNPALRTWLSRDPIEEEGGLNLYGFCRNNPVNRFDKLGEAFFALRPLERFEKFPMLPTGGRLDTNNVEFAHEHLFFEDGENPSNLGFFADGRVRPDQGFFRYRTTLIGYNDCVMRLAVQATPPMPYSLTQFNFNLNAKFNCQDWAESVRVTYERFKNSPGIRKKCCLK